MKQKDINKRTRTADCRRSVTGRLLLMTLLLFTFIGGAKAQNTVTVCDGTTINSNIPVYGYSGDTQGTTSEFVIPATTEGMRSLNGMAITGMQFYVSSVADAAWTATFQVYMKEIDETTLSGTTGPGNCTVVYTGTLDATGTTMDVVFDEGFTYNGGNLLIGTYVQTAGNWKSASFYGIEATGAAYQSGGYDQNGAKNFIPKTTFTYETPSSCVRPENLTVNYTEGNATAIISWTSEAQNFNIDVNGTITAITSTTYTLNVEPATTYSIKVQADCGEEQSGWASTSFFSGCSGISVPYTYGFEDASAFDCWTVEYSDDSYAGITTNLPRTGDQCFWFYYTTNPGQYLISPQLSGITNGLHVEFWYRGYDNGVETFQVGYSTTDNNPDNFTWGDEITASKSYQRFSANYPAGTKYVAVKHLSDDQYYLFLDDFLFEESASCLEPSGLTISGATTTGATLSWTAGGSETAWDIFVTDDATVVPDDTTAPTISGVDANTYNLTALNPCTIYYVYVRSACSSTDASAWSSPVIFHTECEPMVLPYSYGFEDPDLPVSWNTIVENTSYTGINVMAPSTSSTNQVLAFYMGTYQNPALIAVLPEVDEAYPLNRYQITFDACYASTSSSSMTSGKLGIGIMTDPADFTTFELIEEVDITDGYSNFGTHNVCFNSYTGSGRYIAIRDIYTQSGYVLVDNIEVTELPACLTPTNLTVGGGKNAVVTWEGDAESFDVAYSTDNTVDPADNIVDNTTENTFNLGAAVNLTEGDYYVWVRANCGTDGYSDWTSPVSFHVGFCTPDPTSHDGNGITGVSFGTGDYVVTNGDGSASLPASAPYYGDYTSMIGAVQAGVESTIAITTGTNSYPYTFVIWVDLDNSMTFEDNDIVYIGKASSGNGTLNATITIPATQAPGDYRMRIYGADSYFTSFYNGGTTNWEAAHDPCSSGSYRHAHDYTLRVLEAPSCLPAGDLTFEDITSTSAVISWTNNNGVDATYTVMQGETVLTTTAVDGYTLEGLTAATTYPAGTFTIISNCDETMITNVPAFTTECDVIVVTDSWTEGFEGGVLSACWNQDGNGTWTVGVGDYSGTTTGTHAGSYNAMITHKESGDVTKLITPVLDLSSLNNPVLTFWYVNRNWGGDTDGFAVYYRTASDAEWTLIDETADAHETWTKATYMLPNPSATYQIAFEMTDGWGYGVGLDDIVVEEAPVVTLADNADNTSTIADNDGKVANVTLAGRTLYKDGYWNTLTLPFNVDITADGCPLAGADARELVSAEYDGTTLQLTFTGENEVDMIQAGIPYIIKWDSGTNIEDPVFNNVTINKTVNNVKIEFGDGKSITFKGTYDLVTFPTTDQHILFLGENNTLYWPEPEGTNIPSVGACRAYFELEGFTTAETAGGMRFALKFGQNGGEATGIVSAKVSGDARDSWYTVDGVKLNGAPKRKGLYIHNGTKKVVIK